ncbi:conserved hypothetical protein [uncultured Sporomusa sp.]|uniref:Putative restriction endonuclease domain-containing protein n=1 Tax=uncultured Sporomusa sp. TaxID=307249 RepID=A0A212M1Z3_9FIRM|nr:Uma2 family endonuclease [uncultured Sporomusa sp.]SCM83679.1 conserved hypothetical protein [uncultured Sporomusa sp.]
MPLHNEQREYTYKDYLNWHEEERWEIIDGIAYMQATPSPLHQRISGNLYFALHGYFRNKPCQAFAAPFTVRLPMDNGKTDETSNRNIVEPDLVVVCDSSKLDNNGYAGAPTLIVEIVSKTSVKRDHLLKLNKYEQAGVKEYWIIDPETQSIMSYILNEQGSYGKPNIRAITDDDDISSNAFPELTIKLKDIFATW